MDLISIIVPVYGVEAYLDRCVRSLVTQSYDRLEIILVDDGSPDNCPAMCDAWAARDSRIQVIHKENGGLSDARNAGLAAASGEYIAFADSDDWVDAQYIRSLYEALRETDSEIAACDVCVTSRETGESCSFAKAPARICTPAEAIGDILQGTGFRAVAWNKLYKKSLLLHEKYPVGKYHEDEFFTYRILAKANRLVYVDRPLYFYFQRPGSIMNSFSTKHLDVLDAYLERLAFLKESFPELYAKDKVTFCVSCVCLYRELLAQKNADGDWRKKIRDRRKQVRFSFAELRRMSLRDCLYAVGSGICMDVFCKALNIRKGEKQQNA